MSPRVLAFIIFMLSTLLASAAICAEARNLTEYDVKAAYIYNFAKFVEWPSGKLRKGGATITVGIIGKDPFGPALAAIEGKVAGMRKIWVKRDISLKHAGECDILFIARSENEQLEQILEAVGDSGVLTVGDSKGFALQGVMINFFMDVNRVRFEINPASADRAGLRISSTLLKIARIVGTP
jgi:hypothetical protein